ncbi:pyruvate dehydrogenase [bacterium J17]|nr:pyruvate dehydrogenase [bacterium J17]
MQFIRRFEQKLLGLFEEGVLNGTTHACIGQEANSVAVIEHLSFEDHVFSNHRCHGHYLAKTGDALGLLAEIMGKNAGICAGIGGSQHICAPNFKSNGILGGTVPTAAGIAMAKKLSSSKNISTVFLGDGALGEGVVYETMNISSLWELPLLFVVEDNAWSQSTPKTLNFAGEVNARFQAFDIPTIELDTTDVLEIDKAASSEIALIRKQGGPRAIIINTYRLCHHSKNDDNRPKEEVEARWEIEPLAVHGKRLEEETKATIDREVESALDAVIKTARRLS